MDFLKPKLRPFLSRLSTQIIVILVALVGFTALAVGVPALLMLRSEMATALPAADQVQGLMMRRLLIGMALVTLLSSLVGMVLARRLSQPLERLRRAAVSLRMGDLNTPIRTFTLVKEINQVSAALEDARIALQHSLSELRREKEWSDHLLSAVTEGIVTLDRWGRVVFFSPGAERITAWSAAAARGKLLDEVLPAAVGETSLAQQLPGMTGKQMVYAAQFGQRSAALALTAVPLSGGAQPGMVLVFRDVTDEEALHRLLGNFLADITHEFRTPLSAQAAAMELLIDQMPDLSPAEVQDLLGSLRLGVLGLQTLIDNLLEGASIEAGRFKVQPSPTDVRQVIDEAVQIMQPLYDKYRRGLRVDLREPLAPVRVDHRRTVQALVNLLSNSVKWSPEDSEVVIECAPISARDAGRPPDGAAFLRLAVIDRGPGAPVERRGDLFSRFAHQGGERANAGAGIGLSVVKAIIEAQGGKVGVADCPQGGVEFWFTLPLVSGEGDQ